ANPTRSCGRCCSVSCSSLPSSSCRAASPDWPIGCRREGRRRENMTQTDKTTSGAPKAPVILQCEAITVEFDGFKAVQGMHLALSRGELRFLIGPNGAGKTTMLDVICGK